MNWVVIIAGLIPLWAAIFITFTNMRELSDDGEETPVPAPGTKKTILELDLSDKDEPAEEKKGLFGGILGRFRKKEEEGTEEGDPDFNAGAPIPAEQPIVHASIGFPKGIKRLWGAAMILVFLACLAYSSERALEYAFKEYRWVIGTANPWTSQLEFNTMATSALAAVGVMVATVRTGIHLLRN